MQHPECETFINFVNRSKTKWWTLPPIAVCVIMLVVLSQNRIAQTDNEVVHEARLPCVRLAAMPCRRSERAFKIMSEMSKPSVFKLQSYDPLPEFIGFDENATLDPGKLVEDPFWPTIRDAAQIIKRDHHLKFLEQKVDVCTIPKNGQTQLMAYFCLRMGQNVTDESGSMKLGSIYGSCWSKYNNQLFGKDVKYTPVTQDWTIAVVLRNPFNRFLSGYTNKCAEDNMCQFVNCSSTDIECVIEGLPSYLIEIRENMEFGVDKHFYPQAWFCGLSLFQKSQFHFIYLVEDSDAFSVIIKDHFRRLGFTNTTDLFARTTHHQTKGTGDRSYYEDLVQSRPDLIEMLYNVYRVDFEYFGFKLPDWCSKYCQTGSKWKFCERL